VNGPPTKPVAAKKSRITNAAAPSRHDGARQALGELRRMIDRRRQPRRSGLIASVQEAGRPEFAIELHGKIHRDHGPDMSGTGTVTRCFVRARPRFRHLRRTRRPTQLTHRIRHHVAREKQQRQERENPPKTVPVQQRHQVEWIWLGSGQVNARRLEETVAPIARTNNGIVSGSGRPTISASNPSEGESMRKILSPFSLLLFSLFAAPAIAADGQSDVPARFTARIGGFLGASYSVELRDGALVYTSREGGGERSTATVTPTAAQWREFRQTLDELKVWQWQADYPNRGTLDGTQWSLEIAYPDHSLATHGDNNYPAANGKPIGKSEYTDTFTRYLAAVKKLLGGKSFN
jgi:hypothetical protein